MKDKAPKKNWLDKINNYHLLGLGLLILVIVIAAQFYGAFDNLIEIILFIPRFALTIVIFSLMALVPLLLAYLINRVLSRTQEWVNQGAAYERASLSSFKVSFRLERLGDPTITEGEESISFDDNFVTVGDFAFNKHNIRWLGDRSGRNEIILDLDVDGWWYTLKLDAGSKSKQVLEALKAYSPDDINTARYRRRPNLRSDFMEAFVAEQNLQGMWRNREAVRLVITPLWFVALYEGSVLQQIRIDTISDIHCAKHPTALDDTAFLLSFDAEDSKHYSYNIYDESFAKRLEDATRELLDDAPLRKKKAYDE